MLIPLSLVILRHTIFVTLGTLTEGANGNILYPYRLLPQQQTYMYIPKGTIQL